KDTTIKEYLSMNRHHHNHHHAHSPEMAARHHHDRDVFHALLRQHDKITRSVEMLPNGISALTESDDPEIAALIREHAHEMHDRLREGFGLRHWDAAFTEIFAQADKVQMRISDTDKGVRIEEVSDDANVVLLIQAHGTVVTSFVEGGGAVASQESPLPEAYRRVAS
ncbi:MAG: hypothetical protein P8X43_01685, partial [Maritimibacter sp.]